MSDLTFIVIKGTASKYYLGKCYATRLRVNIIGHRGGPDSKSRRRSGDGNGSRFHTGCTLCPSASLAYYDAGDNAGQQSLADY